VRTLVVVSFAIACTPPPKAPAPAPPPAQLVVKSAADVAGAWIASDARGWKYTLSIDKAGPIQQIVERDKLGRCEQKGMLAPTDQPALLSISYAKNECNLDYSGATLQVKVEAFTGDALVLVITGYGGEERHEYTRAYAQ
jgi:hypothetical protein